MSLVRLTKLFRGIYKYWGSVPLFSDWPKVDSWRINGRNRRKLWLWIQFSARLRWPLGRPHISLLVAENPRDLLLAKWSHVTPSESERCREIWDWKRRKMRRKGDNQCLQAGCKLPPCHPHAATPMHLPPPSLSQRLASLQFTHHSTSTFQSQFFVEVSPPVSQCSVLASLPPPPGASFLVPDSLTPSPVPVS